MMLQQPTHAAIPTDKLPEHVQHLAEGAIIDWLIRTGQWDPSALANVDVQVQQDTPPTKALENEPPE